MGFLGFFRKEKVETEKMLPEEIPKVGINEIQSWLENSFGEDINKSKSQGKELYQGVVNSFLDIKDSFRALEYAKFHGKERIHAAANMIKDSFVKKAYPIITNIERTSRETEINYPGLNSFQADASKTLEGLKSTTPKQAVLISRYFKKQSDPIVARMKEAGNRIDVLKKWLGDDTVLRLLEDVKNKRKELLSDIGQIKSLEKKKDEIKEGVEGLREKKKEKESEFLELLKAKDWNEFNTLDKRIKDVKDDTLKIEYEITNELSPMKRPLKKLEHSLKRQDLLFNHKGFLKNFIQDPFESVKEKNGEDSLRRFLYTLNRMVHDRKIELKEKEREKLESLMERMERNIPELKRKYGELRNKKEQMEKSLGELSDVVKKKQELENEIKGCTKDISDMEQEARDTAREQENLKENIKKERKELEELILKETGREIQILG